jgi:hypothetical protein
MGPCVELLPEPVEGRPLFTADPLQGFQDRLLPGRGKADPLCFDDPAFLPRNLLQPSAEILLMF